MFVTNNFKEILQEERGNPGEDDFDLRFMTYCKESTKDLEQYFNYIEFSKVALAEFLKKRTLISVGFLPLITPPSFMSSYFHAALLPKLEERGIQTFPVAASAFANNDFTNDGLPDIWISRFEAAKIIKNKPIHLIKVREIWEALL